MAPGNRAMEAIMRAYEEQHPEAVARTEPIDWGAFDPEPVAYEPRQGGHPYRDGTPEPERPKGFWRVVWERLRRLGGGHRPS